MLSSGGPFQNTGRQHHCQWLTVCGALLLQMSLSSEIENLSLADAQTWLRKGKVSCAELTAAYLDRVDRLDQQVNAVAEVNPEAMDIARVLDEERAAGKSRGNLHGVPIMVKNNIDTGDRMPTTAGSLALQGSLAPQDAFVVKKLRAAGALILGKTNLSEWANMRSSRPSTGWSSLGGQTRNAFDQSRSPGGSSSGSGVAVALGMCAAAVGTETSGSVVIPSAMNSLVGIKPTVGVVGRTGIIPISYTQDTAGPMARTTQDAAILLAAMAGPDPQDTMAISIGKDYLSNLFSLDNGALKGTRIGLLRSMCGYHEGVDAVVENTLATLKSAGAEVIDDLEFNDGVDPKELEDIDQDQLTVFFHEIKVGLKNYFDSLGPNAPMKTIDNVIEFNIENADQTMPFFGQGHLLSAQGTDGLESEAYLRARRRCTEMAGPKGIDAAMRKHKLDALVAPTIGPAWKIDLVNGDNRSPFSGAAAAAAGYPSITVPAGFVHDLPIGLSFFAGHLQDVRLVNLARAFECETQARRMPELARLR